MAFRTAHGHLTINTMSIVNRKPDHQHELKSIGALVSTQIRSGPNAEALSQTMVLKLGSTEFSGNLMLNRARSQSVQGEPAGVEEAELLI